MWLLAELFETLPEVGDLDKPKLVFFFDEAHLLFDGATPAFIDAVTQTVRLIRSKGVGVFFITQTPKDIPGDVLGQLGNRIQHALRAFTPDDEKALRATVKTYPKSDFYDVATLLTSMGIGEAAVTTPLRVGRANSGRAHTARPATLAHGPDRQRRCSREGLTALREVRDARRQPERAGAARGTDGPSTGGVESAPSETAKADRAAKGGGRSRRRRGAAAVTDFLKSRQGQKIEGQVVRGIFGMLKK